MSSPAERYAAFRTRSARAVAAPQLTAFAEGLAFPLDDFQREACGHLEAGSDVLVAAPTGAGKTVVGEFAVHLALAQGSKAFYTTPIKALSNQKYLDLVREHGADRVGLLTGDVTVNGEAPIVVMTTEVLRNMIYARSATLGGLGYVVMDEVHYLADRFRGPVWEEVILLLDASVRLVSLSATVSNAEEFGSWLRQVRGETAVVVSEHRPVPLWQHMMVRNDIVDLFASAPRPGAEPVLNPDLAAAVRRAEQLAGPQDERSGRSGRRGRNGSPRPGRGSARAGGRGFAGVRAPRRDVVIDRLDRAALLPAIVFVFSRAGCEAAVDQARNAGLTLTTEAERGQIRAALDAVAERLPAQDLTAIGFGAFAAAAERGIAAHHAGMLPALKEAVEALFVAGWVKVVFATETLALGVNMPARSVVIERLVKWDGREHAAVTAGEYTQLTGRAGRRGIDVEGHAVVLYSSGVDPQAVAGLAGKRTYPLRSSFRPTYNMAVNLLTRARAPQVREVLESSFAQFLTDRSVVGLARQARKHADALAGYRSAMACDRGDIEDYLALRREIGDAEAATSRRRSGERHRAAMDSLRGLARGDVVEVPRGRRPGWVVVLEGGDDASLDGPRPVVLTDEGRVRTIGAIEAPDGVRRAGHLRVPRGFTSRDARARRDLASSLRNALATGAVRPAAADRTDDAHGDESGAAAARVRLRAHPVHGCPDREDHLRWARRAATAQIEHDRLVERISRRTSSIARDFDRVCAVLGSLGYLTAGDEPRVTPEGAWLRSLYAERDLVLAECLRDGAWDTLDAPGLAALVSCLVYSSRGEPTEQLPRLPGGPSGAVADAVGATARIADRVAALEADHGLEPDGPLDLGLVRTMHAWARGSTLSAILDDGDLAAGDFVRWCKQVIDLLDQLQGAAPSATVRATARAAIHAVRRGVVAQEVA